MYENVFSLMHLSLVEQTFECKTVQHRIAPIYRILSLKKRQKTVRMFATGLRSFLDIIARHDQLIQMLYTFIYVLRST